jgi:hypothetical protein
MKPISKHLIPNKLIINLEEVMPKNIAPRHFESPWLSLITMI